METLRDNVEEITLVDPQKTENSKPLKEVAPISIHPNYLDCHVMIGIELTKELQSTLVEFLKKNYNMFAWSQGNIPGINPRVFVHKLFIDPDHSPICQKMRKLTSKCLKVIKEEVTKLIKANVINESYNPTLSS